VKKIFYIFCFGLLGLVVATIIHAVVEIIALRVIFGNPEQYADTFWWQEWHFIHAFGSGVLWWAGLLAGFWLGFRFWRLIYIEGRHGQRSTQPPTSPQSND
jgi:cell division protein FtsW (lipid II flippase)